jgi:hypothetical protein
LDEHAVKRFHLFPSTATQRHFERARPSALTAVYTVRSTMPTLGTHVGAKLHRAIARVRRHVFDDHHPCAHGAKGARHSRQPLFRRHVMPFRRKRVAPLIRAHGSYLSTRARSTLGVVVGHTRPLRAQKCRRIADPLNRTGGAEFWRPIGALFPKSKRLLQPR